LPNLFRFRTTVSRLALVEAKGVRSSDCSDSRDKEEKTSGRICKNFGDERKSCGEVLKFIKLPVCEALVL
jgi:hypothetical protein